MTWIPRTYRRIPERVCSDDSLRPVASVLAVVTLLLISLAGYVQLTSTTLRLNRPWTVVCIALGSVMMLVAVCRTYTLISVLDDSTYHRTWRILAGLMLLFLGSYAGAIGIVLLDHVDLFLLLTGTVFLFGAVFVLIVVQNSLQTIRDLQRSTTYLATILESMNESLIITSPDGTIEEVNESTRTMLEYSDANLVGHSVGMVFDGAYPRADASNGTISPEETLTSGEQAYVTNADETIPVLVSASPMTDVTGQITGTVYVAHDITERKQYEQQFVVQNRLLRHNIRNEMNVVSGSAEVLQAEVAEPTLTQLTENIQTHSAKILDRTEKLQRFTATREDKCAPIELSELLKREAEKVARANPEVRVTTEIPPDIRTEADRSLPLAIEELLSNAIEHGSTGDSPDEIAITVSPTETQDHVHIRIADTGPGIPDVELTPIREGTETQLEHGSGIGLWLVAWIVRNSGGTLEFTRTETGSTVCITLQQIDSDTDS